MSILWAVVPAWLYAVMVTTLGGLGRKKWIGTGRRADPSDLQPVRPEWGKVLVTNLVFFALLPATLLPAIEMYLPFTGARAGLSLGLTAFLFGCLPVRLFEVSAVGWDTALWNILIDLLRVGGALAIISAMVVR